MPVILATQEVEIKKFVVWSQPGQIVCETLSWETLHKNRAGGVAQGEDSWVQAPVQEGKKEGRKRKENLGRGLKVILHT
jgi:hypothetical protein